ncbi:MAG: FAD-dependent monooxygenase [Burkholderiales bacterium]|nr:FAD-dependent monooxygenase [Burkholderiales bacterium]
MGSERVLIAGAGPVGLIGALYLARRGVPVTLIEGLPAPAEDLRASTFHPPTLDMLEDLGLLAWMLPRGLKSPVFQHRDRPTGAVFSFDLGLLAGEVRNPYRLQCEQWKLMRHVAELLAGMPGVELAFNERVVHVEQSAAGVRVATETPLAIRRHEGRWLIACDGANSIIRKWLGIEFEGMTFPEKFYCVTTPHPFEQSFVDLANVNYVADPDQWFVLLRVPELWRVLIPVAETMADAEIVGDAHTQACLQRIAARDGDYPVRHRTIYRVHQRVAKRYRDGSVFLAGDSAHINNPLGGMGMNGGLHDVLNLADKLLAVLGGADPAVLDRYERQRRTVCYKYVQAQTIRNREDLAQKSGSARERRIEEMRNLLADPAATREFLIRNSMIASLREAAAIE